MSMPPEFLTLAEAAEMLRIGERTCYDLARARRIPAAKVGGQWRIRRSELDDWISKGGEAASNTKEAP